MKVAVVGFGYWARNVVRTLRHVVGERNVLVVESDVSRREAAAATFPGCPTVSALAEALHLAEIDTVFICTPSTTHVAIALTALEAGRHVFVEKPAATSLAGAAELFRKAKQAGRIVFPGHVHLHAPLFTALRQELDAGSLGDLRYAVGYRGSLGPRAREDVSVVWDYLIHDVYIFNGLLGGPPGMVSARGGAYLRSGVCDVAFATLEYPARVLIHLSATWYAPEKARELLLIGSEGMLKYDETKAPRLRRFAAGYRPKAGVDAHGNVGLELFNEGDVELTLDETVKPLEAEIRTFLAMVESGRIAVDAIERHVTEVSATLEAIELSIVSGGALVPVEVPATATSTV